MAFSKPDGNTPKLIQVEPHAHRKAKVAATLAGKDMKTWVSEVIEAAAHDVHRQMGIPASAEARTLGNRPKKGGVSGKKKSQ
ncbi:MAG: hypothetical protein IVW36_07610 [Dehalococcoidia bacterium]|nr:hypothetical protein [Dehalococcoidia bacterium]